MRRKIKDPKVGLNCPVCKRPVPEVAVKNNDPFCSAPCCRKWYGVEMSGMTKQEVRGGELSRAA